ncbi:hypothetical protein [Sinorhizobium sp. NFACC03]|uniref:hypothetical protein n=1 Tax=Sinorhizobium sp. NFACC03 TaxID=1566295 RepID=UPI0008866391|nr:hypothetical protein [Sinorhizobium sp. NFACC03]SDA81312.1 hypothetical protein SAMN03159448_03316 [Sinorhizobium sp. NFACC03]
MIRWPQRIKPRSSYEMFSIMDFFPTFAKLAGVFNIESDPHEEHNFAEMYNWVLGPVLKTVEALDDPKTHRP